MNRLKFRVLGRSRRESRSHRRPLTKRANDAIESQSDVGGGLQMEALRNQRAAMELAADPAAYARFREMYPGS